MTLQGRRFSAQDFPSPADRLPSFSSCSRCLIDLGRTFVVLTEGSGPAGPPHHRMLFRLETVDRSKIGFEDATQLSKEECAALLEEQLEALTECDIVKVEFPFFNQSQLASRKLRPCVALCGTAGPPIYLAIYNGDPGENHVLQDWEMSLSAPQDLSPDSAPLSVVDVSKMCGLPETVQDPDQRVYGMNAYDTWYLDSKKKRHPVAPRDPKALRGKIVSLLMQLLQNNTYIESYFDSTIEQDIGTWVTTKVLIDGEWCERREVYAGPPGMSSAGLDLMAQTKLPPKTPGAPIAPRDPNKDSGQRGTKQNCSELLYLKPL